MATVWREILQRTKYVRVDEDYYFCCSCVRRGACTGTGARVRAAARVASYLGGAFLDHQLRLHLLLF